MNVAANAVRGDSSSSRGVPNCSIRPSFMSAMCVAMVIASTWSWVT
ncbi:hypothetical protein HFP72_09950 [Nocardiopsis sp. ARC36]